MYQPISIKQLNLLLSLSDSLDLASPMLSHHQMRTAFIAWKIGEVADLSSDCLERLFMSSLLHDVGALSLEHKISLHQSETKDPEPHCILGEIFFSQVPMFADSAKVVRYHHKEWQEWEETLNEPIVLLSQILMLADTLERMIDRNKYILHQDQELVSNICSMNRQISPEVAEMLRAIAGQEDFWFDLVSPRLYSLLLHYGPGQSTEIDQSQLLVISEMFRNLIDFRSRFTSTHSSGVAASASALASLYGLTEVEVELMKIAGNLHDLGKLVIPNSILEKPDKLTKEEYAIMRQHTYYTYTVLRTIGEIRQIVDWASFHHEKLDGTGYPFHLDKNTLDIGSRIMAVSDVLTALAEDRPYRKGMGREAVMSILKDMVRSNLLDRNVIRVLEENYDEIVTHTRREQANARNFYDQVYSVESVI